MGEYIQILNEERIKFRKEIIPLLEKEKDHLEERIIKICLKNIKDRGIKKLALSPTASFRDYCPSRLYNNYDKVRYILYILNSS